MSLKHSDVGLQLSKTEWEAAVTHAVDGESEGKIYYYHGGEFTCATPAEIMALLSGAAVASFSMNNQKIISLADPTTAQGADTKAARDAAIVTHTAISAAHHAKYTDAEAVIAVKTGVEVGDLKAPTKKLAMNSQRIDGGVTPLSADEFAIKSYVDSRAITPQVSATDPSPDDVGMIYYNTVLERLKECTQETLDAAIQESNTNTSGYTSNVYGNNWFFQTITPATTYTLHQIDLYCYRAGSPGTITVEIYATSGGKPTGGALGSGTTNGDTLSPLDFQWRSVTMSDIALSSGVQYAIVVRCGGNSSNKLLLKDTLENYAGGTYGNSTDGGSTWNISATLDMTFRAWSLAQSPIWEVIPINDDVLTLDNTTSFTPDADYEPATKKYVDDNAGLSEGTAIALILGLGG